MQTHFPIKGIHHITAVASSAAENVTFYETVLGLRLVKQTVNFDDPHTYHLYYGDTEGSPGTILTFFPWEQLPPGNPGAGMITAIAFAIPRHSISHWKAKLTTAGINVKQDIRFGDPIVQFKDPHGLALELIGTTKQPSTDEHAIYGFYSATALLNTLDEAQAFLTNSMGLTLHGQEKNRYRYMMADDQATGHFYDVLIDPKAKAGRPGGGTVHHIAFRAENDEAQAYWQQALKAKHVAVTDIRDRKYFRSIYFTPPGGVLFEIATDPPGFTVDETVQNLGATLQLPAQYEPQRTEIEKRLPTLRPNRIQHLFQRPEESIDNGQTIVALHGMGGTEQDLIPMVRKMSPASAIVSLRGTVMENGVTRFFKRLANNLFDETDIVHRANAMADFLLQTVSSRYGRSPENLVALGYSNGANMAAAVMLLRPEIFNKAILLRPMLPLQNPALPDLSGKKILILKGAHDAVIPAQSTDQLINVFQKAHARLEVIEMDVGHELALTDWSAAEKWLSKDQEMVSVA